MSEGDLNSSHWRRQSRDDLYSSGSSNEAFRPRRRRRNTIARSTADTDHDYGVEARGRPVRASPVRVRPVRAGPALNGIVDVIFVDGSIEIGSETDTDNSDDDENESINTDSNFSTEASRRNSDHAYADPMITPPPLRLSDDQVLYALQDALNESADTESEQQEEVPEQSATAAATEEEVENETEEPTTPSNPSKKRKHGSPISSDEDSQEGTPKVPTRKPEDEVTCSICFDNWELSGNHRLVALRCGHLFGDSCIRRWLGEKHPDDSNCPQCKLRASPEDIRYLYAKRVRAVDRTEEYRLREALMFEERRLKALQTDMATVKMAHSLLMSKNVKLESENERLREILRLSRTRGGALALETSGYGPLKMPNYKLYLDRTFEITKDPGCRVLVYSPHQSTLIASQKSVMNLFPGYGVRFIDVPTFKPATFLHTSGRIVRDMCLSSSQQELVVASLESRCKLFDLRTRQVASTFQCADKLIWSCAMDRHLRQNLLYLGDQHGSVFIYDVRNSERLISEFPCPEEMSPVVRIAPVGSNKYFPDGGFLVCKLMSVWFYEYANETCVPTRLSVDGPFMSLDYDSIQETMLISTRSNQQHPHSRFILGKLEKINDVVIFNIKITFFGSKSSVILARASQISTPECNTLVVGYSQDNKALIIYDSHREERIQSLSVSEMIFDMCPIYLPGCTYLSALAESKCRIYKVNSTTPN